ncbi:ATP-binding protein, partial [Macellibacteroides fermentans]
SMLRHSLFVILSLLALLLFFAIYIFYINRKINKKNKQLHIKNKESEEQKQKLICLNEKIEQVTSQKLQFFTNVSHEVRTPLTLIVGPLEKWIKSTPESPLLSDLKLMKKNADRLMRVINQLLDFRKIENNKMGLTISQVDIVAFTENVMSLFEDLAKSKEICYEFVSEIPTCQIWIDQDKMEKVLTNLLSNAFKFTAVGGKISVQIKDGIDKIYIALQDNGIGIDEKDIEKIFDRFYTGSVSSGVGAGIGLHLTQEFVNMHQGQILVESVPNDYTIFTIELLKGKDHLPECFPLVHPEDRVDLASTSMNVEKPDDLLAKKYNYTILIVEDDPDIQTYIQSEFAPNFSTLKAGNGAEALAILQSENVSLVLSDVLMPEMNGFELCRRIKSDADLSYIPVVLLTALTDDSQRIYGVSEGADDYIQKPFNIDFLKIKIIRLLEERKRLQKRFMQTMQAGGIPIIETKAKIESLDELFMRKFVDLLDVSYENTELNVEKISEELGISRVQLYRKVKEISGLSPVDYLRNYRLSKATTLLNQKRYSVSEVAYRTGFSSPAYFAKCFKSVFNMTPTEYVSQE